MDESILISRDIRSKFSFLFQFSMKTKLAKRIASDGTPRFAASHLGIYCLPMSHKKDASLMWFNKLGVGNILSPFVFSFNALG